MTHGRIAVIEALISAFTATDQAAALPTRVHPDEVSFARAAVHRAQRDATTEGEATDRLRYLVATLLLDVYRPGDGWDALLDRLTPFQVAELRDLLAYMPPLPARLFTERYSSPL